MFIFLYGEDTFRSRQKLNELVERYRSIHQSGFNFIRLLSFDLDLFKKTIETRPMFSEKKMIILENIFLQKYDQEVFDYLKNKDMDNDQETIIVFWEAGSVDEKNSLLFKKLARKPTMYQDFLCLTGLNLLKWVNQEFTKRGGKIEEAVLKKFVFYVGNDLWTVNNEINKLIAFKAGGYISLEDIDLFLKERVQKNIFQTIEALGSQNKRLASALIQRHLSGGENELYLLTMIIHQFRNLIRVKDALVAGLSLSNLTKQMGLHPFVLKKSLDQAKKFDNKQLKSIYQKLLAAEADIKTGKMEPRLALELLVSEI